MHTTLINWRIAERCLCDSGLLSVDPRQRNRPLAFTQLWPFLHEQSVASASHSRHFGYVDVRILVLWLPGIHAVQPGRLFRVSPII